MSDWGEYVEALVILTELRGSEARAHAELDQHARAILEDARLEVSTSAAEAERLAAQVAALEQPMMALLAGVGAAAVPTAAPPSLTAADVEREARALSAWIRDAEPRLQSLTRTRSRLEARPAPPPPPPPTVPEPRAPEPQRHRTIVIVAVSMLVLLLLIWIALLFNQA